MKAKITPKILRALVYESIVDLQRQREGKFVCIKISKRNIHRNPASNSYLRVCILSAKYIPTTALMHPRLNAPLASMRPCVLTYLSPPLPHRYSPCSDVHPRQHRSASQWRPYSRISSCCARLSPQQHPELHWLLHLLRGRAKRSTNLNCC